MAQRGRSSPLLGWLLVLIPLLGCSPRPLLRFVRDLVAPAAKAPAGAAVTVVKPAGKTEKLKAVASRAFRHSRPQDAADGTPTWPGREDAALTASFPPAPTSGASRGESADPAYLRPFLRSGFGSTPAPPL